VYPGEERIPERISYAEAHGSQDRAWNEDGRISEFMTEPSTGPREDPYARAEYRRVIAWGPRIERERPFLLSLLERAPDRSVVDLGCGTGEHVAFFAEVGARAIGIDRSEDMISQARDHEARGKG